MFLKQTPNSLYNLLLWPDNRKNGKEKTKIHEEHYKEFFKSSIRTILLGNSASTEVTQTLKLVAEVGQFEDPIVKNNLILMQRYLDDDSAINFSWQDAITESIGLNNPICYRYMFQNKMCWLAQMLRNVVETEYNGTVQITSTDGEIQVYQIISYQYPE